MLLNNFYDFGCMLKNLKVCGALHWKMENNKKVSVTSIINCYLLYVLNKGRQAEWEEMKS